MDTLSHIKMLFDSMIGNSDILMFGIYKEKSGSTLLKVRFADQDQSLSDGGTQNTPIHFRRKSDKQLQRDIRRAQQHKYDSHIDSQPSSKTENPQCVSSSPVSCNSDEVHGVASPVLVSPATDPSSSDQPMHNVNMDTNRHFTDILDSDLLVDQSTDDECVAATEQLDSPLTCTMQNSEMSNDCVRATQSQDGQSFSNDLATHDIGNELIPGTVVTGAEFVRAFRHFSSQLDNETKTRLLDMCNETRKRLGNHNSDSSDNT